MLRLLKLVAFFAGGAVIAAYLAGGIFTLVTHLGDDSQSLEPQSLTEWISFLNGEALYVAVFGLIYAIPFSVFVLLPIYYFVFGRRQRS